MSQSLVLSLVSPVSSLSTWIINGTCFLHTLRRNAFGRKLWKLCKTCVFVRSPKFQRPWSPLLCSLSHYTFCVPCGLNCSFCLTLCDPMDCSPPGSSVHGILQARILEWVAMPPSVYLPNPGIEPASLISPALARGFFTNCVTWEALCVLWHIIIAF